MSRRTVEASKAIRLAWEKEQELVREGKGTRDWTEEQQKDILNPDKGKAYDEDGKAFEGHHMKSAEAYPEYQGNPENIQFLTRTEHTQAHGGWQKPTNGYYDYKTGKTYDFDEDEFIPCKIIKLSNPVIMIDVCNVDTVREAIYQVDKELSSGTDPPIKDIQQPDAEDTSIRKAVTSSHRNQVPKEVIIDGLSNVVNAVEDFSDKHPVLTTVAKVSLGLAVTAVSSKAIHAKVKINQQGGTGHRLLNNQALKGMTETAMEVVSKFEFKKSESALKQLGYTVEKNMGLSDVDRQKILQNIISSEIVSKEVICAFLENNINLHKNQNSFADAVEKWVMDLAYIRNVM